MKAVVGTGSEQQGGASIASAWGSAVVGVLLLAGCAAASTAPSAPLRAPPPALTAQRGAIAAKPIAAPAVPTGSGSAGQGVARPAALPPEPADQVASSPLSLAQAPPKGGRPAAPVAKPAAPPPLDLRSLETRLRETRAIGPFAKLAVKIQVDDLLNRIRAFYQGRLKTTLAELRRSYDLLVVKVLALLQEADPSLAHAIAASRESIWGVLSNRERFSRV